MYAMSSIHGGREVSNRGNGNNDGGYGNYGGMLHEGSALRAEGVGRADRGPIVVIDDSLTVRKIMEVALRREEMAALCFANGFEALRVLKGRPGVVPSLIFLDVGLPQMSGYTFLRLLRSDPRFDETPIILLTGQDGVLARLRGHLAGATSYMTKPFKTRDIVEVATRYIQKG